MSWIINPGSGPVANAEKRHALACIRVFRRDLGFKRGEVTLAYRGEVPGGRYLWTLTRRRKRTLVEMPGWPLERVRFSEGANVWLFPRLYVDGSSWLWPFAVESAREQLSPTKASK